MFAEGFSYAAIAVLGRDARFDFTRISEREAELVERVTALLESQGDALVALDADLGWVYRANHRGALYSSNSFGARGKREYGEAKLPGVYRIAAFGDSFTHGNEVSDEAAWSAQLEALDPRVEVLNFGVGGYGTDQALLLFERWAARHEVDLVLLGFAEPDYARNLNRFRRFMSVHELPMFKPRFAFDDAGALLLLPNPMRGEDDYRRLQRDPSVAFEAAEQDWFFEPLEWRNPIYDVSGTVRLASTVWAMAWRSVLRPDALYRDGRMNPDGEGIAVLEAIVERFARGARARDLAHVFMIFPTRDDDVWGGGGRSYGPLLDRLGNAIPIVDLAEGLAASEHIGPANLRRDVHYSEAANAVVARSLHDFLVTHDLLAPTVERQP